MSWLPLSIFALVMFSVYDVIARDIGVNSRHPQVFSGIYNLFVALISIFLIFLEPIPQLHLTFPILLLTAVNLTVWGLFGRLEYKVHQKVEASLLTIILKLAPVMSFVIGIIVFQETLTVGKLIGLALILGANLVILSKPESLNINKKGMLLSLVLALLLSMGWSFDKAVSPHYGLALFTVISFLSPAVFALVHPLAKPAEILSEIKLASWRMPLAGLCNGIGYAAFVKALMIGDASQVTPIATATPPLVVLISYVFLKERHRLVSKLLATGLIVGGIVLLR